MEVRILLFGVIAERCRCRELTVPDVTSTDELMAQLTALHFPLKEMKYSIAVNKKIINANAPLTQGCEVALLPPFSGG